MMRLSKALNRPVKFAKSYQGIVIDETRRLTHIDISIKKALKKGIGRSHHHGGDGVPKYINKEEDDEKLK
ncbi:hypothetical protein AgCh_039017 [Apium graveolens]